MDSNKKEISELKNKIDKGKYNSNDLYNLSVCLRGEHEFEESLKYLYEAATRRYPSKRAMFELALNYLKDKKFKEGLYFMWKSYCGGDKDAELHSMYLKDVLVCMEIYNLTFEEAKALNAMLKNGFPTTLDENK